MSDFSSEPIVSIKDATIFQETNAVVSGVNFDIQKGEFVYLIGRTGSGKSSILKTIYADLPLMTGYAQVAGFELSKIKQSEVPYLRRKVGIIFQDFELLPDRTVGDNLRFVMKATGWSSNQKIKEKISEVLMKVGLDAYVNKYPYQLSGGEQQRVVIARAIINEPLILVADEPTGNLDPKVADEIFQLFRQINNSGTAILMATHNHTFLKQYPERVLKLDDKRLLDSKKDHFEFTNVF